VTDLEQFIRDYTSESLVRIRYAGSTDPLEKPRRDPSGDPNFPYRKEVIEYLVGPHDHAGPPAEAQGHVQSAPDALLHDLFVAHWEFAVTHDHHGNYPLATEVLRRRLYRTFVHVYRLPLGMEQGVPLEAAISHALVTDEQLGTHFMTEIGSLVERETDPRALKNLTKWQGYVGGKTSMSDRRRRHDAKPQAAPASVRRKRADVVLDDRGESL
jgi:hypothetical protein